MKVSGMDVFHVTPLTCPVAPVVGAGGAGRGAGGATTAGAGTGGAAAEALWGLEHSLLMCSVPPHPKHTKGGRVPRICLSAETYAVGEH